MVHLVLIKQGWNKSVTLRFILRDTDGDDCAAYVDNIIANNMQQADAPPSPRLIRSKSHSGPREGRIGWGEGTRRRFIFGRLTTQKLSSTPIDRSSCVDSSTSQMSSQGVSCDARDDWQCDACTFRNVVSDAVVCEVCGASRGALMANHRVCVNSNSKDHVIDHLDRLAADVDFDDNCARERVSCLAQSNTYMHCSSRSCVLPPVLVRLMFAPSAALCGRAHRRLPSSPSQYFRRSLSASYDWIAFRFACKCTGP